MGKMMEGTFSGGRLPGPARAGHARRPPTKRIGTSNPGTGFSRVMAVSQDIDAALRGWEYKSGSVQARLVKAADGRQVLQMRVDLGLLQMETAGRPDGTRPHGYSSYFE